MLCLKTLRSCSFAPHEARTERQNWLSTMPLHYGLEQKRIETGPLACPFARLLAPLTPSHHSLARLLCPACFVCALCWTHSFARSLTSLTTSLPHSWGSELLMSQNDLVLSHSALWARTTKNTDRSTGPLAGPFACSLEFACSTLLALLAHSTALTHSLAHSLHSLARGTVID